VPVTELSVAPRLRCMATPTSFRLCTEADDEAAAWQSGGLVTDCLVIGPCGAAFITLDQDPHGMSVAFPRTSRRPDVRPMWVMSR